MSNAEISKVLRYVAASYSIKDENKFRFQIIAYQRAADSVDHSPAEIKDLFAENKNLPGVGKSIRASIEELIKKGKSSHFESIMKDIPRTVFPLLEVPGFGPKRAFKLATEFNLNNPETVISDLADIAKEGKIATLPGFGEKSQEDILRAIGEFWEGKTKSARMVLPYANELAKKLIDHMRLCPQVIKIFPLGSLRRKRETVGDIDIAVASNDPKKVLDHFTSFPETGRIIEKGDHTSSVLTTSGRQIDLMIQSPEGFGALLQHFTGSKAHNVHLREYALSRGLSLSEYGIKRKVDGQTKLELIDTEEEFYKKLGLSWIPPEMREDSGEIELAMENKLPTLIELKDIKGDFHLHSSYPIEPSHDMGRSTMEEMIEHALELKYEYLAFAEHNPSVSKHTKAGVKELLTERCKFIEQLRLKYQNRIHIFSLLEVDILPDGSLAADDDALSLLDGAIVSIHSSFDMNKTAMTDRVIKGLSHPKARILAHPTGRLLNDRPGYELDWDRIFTFCKENNKALEINAWPARLDLPDLLVREALKNEVKLTIDTDSHAANQMNMMEYGVSVARRGWAGPRDILNSLPYNELVRWFNNG